MTEPGKLKSVEQYGKQYLQEYLARAQEHRATLKSDPLAALEFMYGKLFMRGRRDQVSVAFRDRALTVLQTYKRLEDIDLGNLDMRLRAERVNNRYDRRMVIESIEFVRTKLQACECNVFKWAVAAIKGGSVDEAYSALTGIFAVGDKLATFYLRDVTLIEGIEGCIRTEDYIYFQPVDTWVEQVAHSLGIVDVNDLGSIWTVKHKIIAACVATDVSPLLFNAGAWMVGAHAYRLLLERL